MLRAIERAKSLVLRLRWLAPVAGGILPALRLANRIRHDKRATREATYRGVALHFRGIDERAIKEVLFDREYDFGRDYLASRQAPLVIDAGAHIGTFGLWVLSNNRCASIVSVEADPETFELLRANAGGHVRRGVDWTVLHRAASDRGGEVAAFATQGASMSHRLSSDGDAKVVTIDMAEVFKSIDHGRQVDLMKVDIEGAEEAFLCARPELLLRVSALAVELHPDACNTDRVREILRRRYRNVVEIKARTSSKPLLFCHDLNA